MVEVDSAMSPAVCAFYPEGVLPTKRYRGAYVSYLGMIQKYESRKILDPKIWVFISTILLVPLPDPILTLEPKSMKI